LPASLGDLPTGQVRLRATGVFLRCSSFAFYHALLRSRCFKELQWRWLWLWLWLWLWPVAVAVEKLEQLELISKGRRKKNKGNDVHVQN
jgi:hypothetical protein